jgi:uncharacterized protein YfaS (alpha-2-macroglobulin family)
MALLNSAACGSSGGGRGGGDAGDADGGGDDPPAELDHTNNGVIEVDEVGLRGSLDGGQLEVSIPVRAVHDEDRASGTLEVALHDLDGTMIVGHTTLDYELARGEETMLHARVGELPDNITQAGFASFVVRIEQAGERPLRVRKSLFHMLPLSEVRFEGPASLRASKTAVYRALVQDPLTRAPIADQEVELLLRDAQGGERTLNATSDETGTAMFELSVEDAGDYTLVATSEVAGVAVELSSPVTVDANGRKVLLTTDKPIYQPGQTMHLRALALNNPDNTPLAETDVVFEVEDGKGNKVMKRTVRTNGHGIASTRFTLAHIVNMGTYKLRANASGVITEKTVTVARYVLPKMDVSMTTDRAFYTAGADVAGTLSARYFFGRDVAGASVAIEASTLDAGENVFQRVMGVTDANGDMSFGLTLPSTLVGLDINAGNAVVNVRATVTDTAGQVVVKELALTVARSAIRIALVPEATSLVPGIENRVHVFVTDPLGGPVGGASVTAAQSGMADVTGETDAYGHLTLRWTPGQASGEETVTVTVDDGSGASISETFSLRSQLGAEHVLVRTDKSIYKIGETVSVEILTSSEETVAYVDWISEGQAVDMRTLAIEDGVARFAMPADSNLIGGNRIEAYVVDVNGNVARAGRSVVIKNEGALDISLDTDKNVYAPGEPAALTFTVVDDQGAPAVAALGVQIVDEAVFGLIDARPGLLKTYFEIEDAFATPDYEIKGPVASFESLLFAESGDEDEVQAAQITTEASLAALRSQSMFGMSQSSFVNTLSEAKASVAAVLASDRNRLRMLLLRPAQRAVEALSEEGCTFETYWCEGLSKSFEDAVATELIGGSIDSDYWGNAFAVARPMVGFGIALVTRGPDEKAGTSDDQELTFATYELELGGQSGGSGMFASPDSPNAGGGNGGAGGQAGTASAGTGGTGGAGPVDEGSEEPRVRSEFPETLYVNPSIITDESGQATIQLDMADSITEWRVSALANAASGKLGGSQAGIRVFQDFFVDVSFPAELTRGDEVEVPVVLYNYLDEPQDVRLEVEPADWYTALGSVETTVALGAGEVRAVRVPVRVETVGTQAFTVRAFGSDASDAVARTVRVIPNGTSVPTAQSGSLEPGNVTLSTLFPVEAVPGSAQLYLDVFPAFFAQAVSGLDSILMEPNGCFEQTTSTTWPNVLVTRYMQATDQITPEIALKAEALINTGYQRLLTFEHPGGGFSWFGTDDPAPYLSVTAFGLMEFADMAGVAEVDPAMIERTESYLLSQQQADGSWPGDQTEFFSFQESVARNTAFTAWALAQNGYTGSPLSTALNFVKANVSSAEMDLYTLALAANAFVSAAPSDAYTTDLLERLDDMKSVDGDKTSWNASMLQTDFYASGDDASITTTALIAHAFILADYAPGSIEGALNYLSGQKDASGNFGSTQATVWTLKTMLLAAQNGTTGAVGTLEVALDGESFATVELTEEQADVMTRVDMSPLATIGAHDVELTFAGTGKVSYALVSQHHVPWGAQPPDAGPLAIAVEYDRTTLAVEETVSATATIANTSGATLNMILITLGIPPGFEVATEDLDEQVRGHAISRYEVTGRQLIVYLTKLGPLASFALAYRLRALMPVRAVDGGAEARMYYEPEKVALSAAKMLVAEEP